MAQGVIVVVLTFAMMILVHEFGHLVFAKMFGITVKEFAIGFGPKLCSRVWRGTEYSIRAIPMGGFNDIEIKRELTGEHDFYGKPLWQRLVVLFAGSYFNICSALVALWIFVVFNGVPVVNTNVVGVIPDTVAANYFVEGDKVLSVNGVECDGLVLSDIIKESDALAFSVDRGGEIVEFEIAKDTPTIGVILGKDNVHIPFAKTFEAAGKAWIRMIWFIGRGLQQIVSAEVEITSSVSGPVGISTEIYKANSMHGIYGVIVMFALISVNLGFVNLFPIPCLDGGHIVLQCIDAASKKIFGKTFSERQVEYLSYAGVTFLLAIFLLGLYADIVRLSA